MKVLFEIKKENLDLVKDKILKDDVVSRASVVFKEAKSMGFSDDVYYCYISGLEEACEKAKDLLKESGKEVKGKKGEDVIKKIKEEEEAAMKGFGDIFR